jgi:hypothetical protein
VEKYGTAVQATGDNMGLMLHRKDAIACQITEERIKLHIIYNTYYY